VVFGRLYAYSSTGLLELPVTVTVAVWFGTMSLGVTLTVSRVQAGPGDAVDDEDGDVVAVGVAEADGDDDDPGSGSGIGRPPLDGLVVAVGVADAEAVLLAVAVGVELPLGTEHGGSLGPSRSAAWEVAPAGLISTPPINRAEAPRTAPEARRNRVTVFM
jgi:hypothetical protein